MRYHDSYIFEENVQKMIVAGLDGGMMAHKGIRNDSKGSSVDQHITKR